MAANVVQHEGQTAPAPEIRPGTIIHLPVDGSYLMVTDEDSLIWMEDGILTAFSVHSLFEDTPDARILPPGTKVTITVGGAP